MKFIEKFIIYLFPNLLLRKNSWKEMYFADERESFLTSTSIFLVIIIPVYILHYYTVDKAEGLAPSQLWFKYRYGMAALALVTFIIYKNIKNISFKILKLPLAVSCGVFTFFQANTVVWYDKVPYLYSYMFVLISVYLLRLQVGYALLYTFINCLVVAWIYSQTAISSSMIFSASIVTSIFSLFMSSKNLTNVKLFIAKQNDLENKQKLIQANLQLVEQLRSFLPKNIFTRILELHKTYRMNLTQSMDEVLRPRQSFVCCLYSDIRGFTQKSNDLEGFVKKEMIPFMKECSMVIEDYGGIPRKIGDLIFAYFEVDSKSNIQSEAIVSNAISAVAKMIEIQIEMKRTYNLDLKRNNILTYGKAVVGNIGGVNSSVEITAIGSPSNLAARIDEWIKRSGIEISETSIVFDPSINSVLENTIYRNQLSKIEISSSKIRDFENINEIYFIDTKNLSSILLQKTHQVNEEAS